MKKLAALLLALLLAPSALGQSVGASQIKKKANGGLVADSANALTVAVHRGATAPSSPVTGQLWCDTTTDPCSMKVYSGSAWGTSPNTAVQVQATLSTLPASPTDGQIVWVSSQARAVVYDATAAKWYYLDGPGRLAGADYSIDTVGYSTAFLTPPDTTGSVVAGGAMTVGDHTCAVTYYNEIGGETTPGAGFTGTVGTNKTFALSFAATTTGAFGKRVYCSLSGSSWPLFLVASIDDTTTATYNVTVADTSFGLVTAPDENFSAPLPSGWVGYVPDRSYGGCGSTGDGLLCSALKVVTVTTTSAGPRMAYLMTSDPAAWRASWTVTRLDAGFPGRTSYYTNYVPHVQLMLDPTSIAAGSAGFSWYGVGLPFSPSATPALLRSWRFTSAAAISDGTYIQLWPPITGLPIYAQIAGRLEGAERSISGQFSSNGRDWTRAPFVIGGASTAQRSYTTGWPLSVAYPYITFPLERISPSAHNTAGLIIKITGFRWSSE